MLSFSQNNWNEMSGKQRAFFYNVSRNIENIKPELLHLFEFTDSIPFINDTLPDYAYVEKKIVEDSTKLLLHYSEFSRKNNGLIADLATHYAIWELDLILQFRKSSKPKFQYLKPKLKQFEKYIIETAPQAAIKTLSNGNYELSTSVNRYYAPNLSIKEKIAAIKNSGFSENDQLLIIRSVYSAQEKYILNRSLEIFKLLGGKVDKYINYLIAAGDGENYSELESVFRSKYSRALPDPKALFNFEVVKNKKTNQQELETSNNPIKKLITHPIFPTQIHIDVWGFHPERQTTIVIQKGGNSYILYGNNEDSENRCVSPDSTYGEGSTYWRLIYELENIHIADLKEKIYGKKGYDYWIAEYEERIEVTRLKIKVTEKDLNEIRYEPASTKNPKIKKKKIKKKDLGKSDQAGKGHPTQKPTGTAKKKQKLQNRLIALNTQLENEMRTLKELKIEKEKAFDILASYETLLDKMMKNVGHSYVEYEKDKQGNYTFDDGSTFNYFNQDFMFKPNGKTENFEIITLAFGEKVFSKTIEEVFVHLNINYPNLKHKFTLFKAYAGNEINNKLTVSDSIQIMELFWTLGKTNKKLNINAVGGGIIGGTYPDYFRDSLNHPVPYKKENIKAESVYLYRVDVTKQINAKVTNFRQNMIPYNFNTKYGKYYAKAKAKIPQLNEIDFYTVILAKKRMDIWLEQLNNLANNWLTNTDYQSKVISKLNSAKNKYYYSIISNSTKIKIPKK
jgi:hypothetical protein